MSEHNPTENFTLFDHLIELRSRLLKSVLSVLIIFVPLAFFRNELYFFAAQPLQAVLPPGATMIATDVASSFFAPFKLAIVMAIFVAMPVILYQIWGFIAPGLYQNEKRLIAPLMFGSTFLFYSGIAFVYFVVFPLMFSFFASVMPLGIMQATDISSYLDFILKLFFAFGIAFEIPVAIVLMCATGITTPEKLKIKRPYIVVGAFVIGMLLTPPDAISQTLLAIPMLLLFEVGLFLGKFYSKPETEESEESSNVS